jgi:hypothetical protein
MEGGGVIGFLMEASYLAGNSEGLVISNGSYGGFGASIPPAYVFLHRNTNHGLICSSRGSVAFGSGNVYLNAQYNGTYGDVYVMNFGLVNNNAQIIGSRIFNATPGVMKSDGGLIN